MLLEPWVQAEKRRYDGVCTSVRTRLTHASSAAHAWQGGACPETPGAMRPAPPRAALAGGARHGTPHARVVGSVGCGWATGALLPRRGGGCVHCPSHARKIHAAPRLRP
jgi:hypothetical protein